MYGHDVHTLEASKLTHEARANGWTSLSWIAQNGDMWRLFGVPPEWLKEGDVVAFSIGKYAADWLQIQTKALYRAMADGWTALRWVDDRDQGLFHLVGKRPESNTTPPKEVVRYSATAASGDYVWIEVTLGDTDGPPRIRSELGGLMGPGYQATGYDPPPRRRVLLDDPTGDDIAGDVLP